MSTSLGVTDGFMSSGMRRPYPKGPKREMNPDWKERARVRLEELGKSADWLAEELRVSRGMVRKMLGPKQNTSSLVDEVSRVLGIEPPVLVVQGAREREAFELIRRANPDQLDAIITILRLSNKEPS